MSWAELVAAAEVIRAAAVESGRAAALDRSRWLATARLAGIGWATVDHERAQQELDGLLARDPAAPSLAPWTAMDRDPALGAALCQRASAGSAVPSLVVLEPDTEARLAAFLARF